MTDTAHSTRDYRTVALADLGYLFTRNYRGAGVNAPPNAGAERTLADLAGIRGDVDHLIVCLDAPPYRRRDAFPDYKAQREEPPPEELAQKKALVKELQRLGYRLARVKGYEADDLIATLAKAYAAWCHEVRLVCPDKDAAQLITKNVIQFIPEHGTRQAERRDAAGCWRKFGVTPSEMPLFQALMGDSSDNIPGVEGVGKVKAKDVLEALREAKKPPTLAGLADFLATTDSALKVWKDIAAQWEPLKVSLDLVTLDAAAPLDVEDLLLPHLPMAASGPAPTGEVELPEYLGNQTPQPELLDAEFPEASEDEDPFAPAAPAPEPRPDPGDAFDRRPMRDPEPGTRLEPRIGKAPEADAVLSAAKAEFERARAVAPLNTSGERSEEKVTETATRIATGNLAEQARAASLPPQPGPGIVRAVPREAAEVAASMAVEKYGLTTQRLECLDLRAAWTESNWLAKSGLYKGYDTPEKVFAVILRSKELGISLGTALAGFHPMEGKLTPSADLIRSLAERDPNCEYLYLESADATQATWVTKHRKHTTPRRFTYTIEEAREVPEYFKKDRWGNPGNWEKRPKEMLTKTAGSKLAREVYPGACLGLYCMEEMGNGILEAYGEAA